MHGDTHIYLHAHIVRFPSSEFQSIHFLSLSYGTTNMLLLTSLHSADAWLIATTSLRLHDNNDNSIQVWLIPIVILLHHFVSFTFASVINPCMTHSRHSVNNKRLNKHIITQMYVSGWSKWENCVSVRGTIIESSEYTLGDRFLKF